MDRTGGAELSSTGRPNQLANLLGIPGSRLAAAGGRPRLPIGQRGHLLGSRGRLLRPRLDLLKKQKGKGGRPGKKHCGFVNANLR